MVSAFRKIHKTDYSQNFKTQMKSTIYYAGSLAIACLLVWQPIAAQSITSPRTSPAAEVSQTIGISKVTINYSRPGVKGREIWGKLVPYGFNYLGFGTSKAAPWRAGANENTTITFTDDAKVDGNNIPAGTYGLFLAVNDDGSADLIFSKNSTSWGSFFYNKSEDQLRVKIQSKEHAMTERLTYDFIDLTKNSATAVLNWEKKAFPFTITFDVDNIVMANARNELRNVRGFGWQGPASAAQYCLQNKINQEEGLTWAEQAVANTKNFNTLFVKAGLLDQLGRTSQAVQVYDLAAEKANQRQLNFLANQMMNRKRDDKALTYFKLNVKNNPDDAHVHVSLGEYYAKHNNKKEAIKLFKKSLSLDPPAKVKANSIKNLKELGVDTSTYEKS